MKLTQRDGAKNGIHRKGLLNRGQEFVGGESAIAVPFNNEFRNPPVRFRQRLLVWQEDDTEVLRARFLAEAGAVDDHNVLLADQFLYESLIALPNLDAGECVEGATRRNAAQVRCLLTPCLREIAAGSQLALYLGEMILWTFQSRLDRILLGMIGAQARTQQAMQALGVSFQGRGVAGNDAPSDTPSGNEIIF